jgi:SNF2 family DNA or RNA helicase
MLAQVDAAVGISRRGLILAGLTRLKQICDHPALLLNGADDTPAAEKNPPLDDRSGKCERLIDMLEEVLEENESALVFTQYAKMGTLLERLISQRLRTPPFYLHGGTPQKQRDEMVQEFQTAREPRVFILSLRAGGLGLNLTAASHVFHFDRWWNPAVENQATDRAHRIGQTRRVQVHKFVAIGTLEERIDKMLSEKTQLSETVVGAGDQWLTELSTAELREYIALSDAAVGEF